jgi:hypothetical protein
MTSSRCQCGHCAGLPFTQLAHSAQADTDQAHRQAAMAAISVIAPYAGNGADQLARPALDQLYPASATALPFTLQAILDEYRPRAQAIIDAITGSNVRYGLF